MSLLRPPADAQSQALRAAGAGLSPSPPSFYVAWPNAMTAMNQLKKIDDEQAAA